MHGTLHKWLQFSGPKRRGDGLASRHNCRRSIEVVRNGVRAQRSDGVDFFHFSNPTGKPRTVLRRIIAWQSHNLPERGYKGTGE